MIDFQSQTWAGVKAHAEKRLTALRDELEAESTTPERTQAIRGAIKELSALLGLAAPRPRIPTTQRTASYT